MRLNRALMISIGGHAVVAAVSYFGLPLLNDPLPLVDQPMVIEVVTVAEVTNAPPPAPEPEKEPEPEPEPPKPEPKPVPPPPPPPPPPPEPTPPPPEPAPEPEPVPEPEPEPEPEPVPEPVPPPEPEVKAPEPKPEPKPQPPQPVAPVRLAQATPQRKPKPPDPFASVLRTVEDLKKQPPAPTKTPEKPEQKKETFEELMANALSQPRRQSPVPHDVTAPLTISEIDLVRQQIARCWLLPAGAKDAENLVIEIGVELNPDGTVRSADIRDKAKLRSDPFFRSAAESALRAVNNPKCSPFRLPRDKYERWKTMTLTFNPKEMFGT